MEWVEAQVEEVHVAVAIGPASEPADLAVDTLHDTGADGMVEAAEDLPSVRQHRVGERFERQEACGMRLENPLLQILLRRFLARLVPELAKLLFEICLASSSFVKKSARKVLRLVIVKRA